MGGLVSLPRHKDNCLCDIISYVVYGYGALRIIYACNNILIFYVATKLICLYYTSLNGMVMWIYTVVCD